METSAGEVAWRPTSAESAFATKLGDITRCTGGSPTLLGKVCRTMARFAEMCGLVSCKRSWEVHVAAEHMAQEGYSGNASSVGLSSTAEHLEALGHRDLAQSLFPAAKISKRSEALLPIPALARSVRKDVQALNENESLVIPVGTRGHALLMEVTCTGEDVNGKKIFSVTIHNTGGGLEYHHSRIVDGKKMHQTAYEIFSVSEDSLCGENSSFFQKLFGAAFHDTDHLYKKVLPTLDGELGSARRPEERAFWSHGQMGGSCTASCVLSYLRSHMTRDEYKSFKESVRMEVFLKQYEIIRAGKATSHTVNITMEIGKKLLKRMESPQLQAAMQDIETTFSKLGEAQKTSSPSSPHGCTERVKSLSLAFEALKKKGAFTSERREIVEAELLRSGLLEEGMLGSLSPEEKEDLRKLAEKIATYLGNEPMLTKDQICLYAALALRMRSLDLPEKLRKNMNSVQCDYVQMNKTGLMTHPKIVGILVDLEADMPDQVSREAGFHVQQFSLNPPLGRVRLSQITDGALAIEIGVELLKQKKLPLADVLCALIENPSVAIEDIHKKLGLKSKDIPESTEIENALRTRSGYNTLPSVEQTRYDKHVKVRVSLACNTFGRSWYESMVYGHACAQICITEKTYSLNTLPRDKALKLATAYWMIPQERADTFDLLSQNAQISIEDLQGFLDSKTQQEIDMARISTQMNLKTRFQSELPASFSEKEKGLYLERYDKYYEKARSLGVSWFTANKLAHTCAMEYVLKVRKATAGPEKVDEYFERFSVNFGIALSLNEHTDDRKSFDVLKDDCFKKIDKQIDLYYF